jgi:hypothetical protein
MMIYVWVIMLLQGNNFQYDLDKGALCEWHDIQTQKNEH